MNVSVIMAEYNTKPEYLKASIQSILNQTYNNFEFIIIDDGSNNDLHAIAEKFNDSRLKIISNDRNRGLVYSLNNAIKHSKGKYLVRMDTDDLVVNDRIEILYQFIQSHPEYDVVSSRAVEFSGGEEFGIIGKSGEKKKHDIMRGDMLVHAASIMKKKSIEAVGGYKEYSRAEDLVLWCELLMQGKRLYMLDDVLYQYRVNKDDYKKRTLKNRKGEIKARLEYYPKLGANPIDYTRIIKSIIAGVLPVSVIRAYRNTFIVNKKDEG